MAKMSLLRRGENKSIGGKAYSEPIIFQFKPIFENM